jgi:hypothetical protein
MTPSSKFFVCTTVLLFWTMRCPHAVQDKLALVKKNQSNSVKSGDAWQYCVVRGMIEVRIHVSACHRLKLFVYCKCNIQLVVLAEGRVATMDSRRESLCYKTNTEPRNVCTPRISRCRPWGR